MQKDEGPPQAAHEQAGQSGGTFALPRPATGSGHLLWGYLNCLDPDSLASVTAAAMGDNFMEAGMHKSSAV
jgi:hypothetical protein